MNYELGIKMKSQTKYLPIPGLSLHTCVNPVATEEQLCHNLQNIHYNKSLDFIEKTNIRI